MVEDQGLMDDGYIVEMAKKNAKELARYYKVDIKTAFYITFRLLFEARRSITAIVGEYGAENWQRMSIAEKSVVCSEVVKGLLDKEKIEAFIKGRSKSLLQG
ncbi:hypothetical protein MNBD_DELTA01-1637 [hydrothermal vent metagenome]|uniref:Uncharacterized protein n=1 Tax=hydrothermal vent metagenome TaxID=652676 RepID=A0A3B0RCZ3_9ZZZZ